MCILFTVIKIKIQLTYKEHILKYIYKKKKKRLDNYLIYIGKNYIPKTSKWFILSERLIKIVILFLLFL